jgi:hypothetical protein
MTDFNTAQMSQLLGDSNVTVVYLWADGDYWLRQQEFCAAFRAAPATHNVVIHVQFEGLSRVQRHRLVYDSLQEFLDNGLHALAIEFRP